MAASGGSSTGTSTTLTGRVVVVVGAMVVVGAIVVVGATVVVGAIVVVGATVEGNAVVSVGVAASLPEPLVNAVEQPTRATKPKTMPHPMHAVRRSAGTTAADDTCEAVLAECTLGYFHSISQFCRKTENTRQRAGYRASTSTAAVEVWSFDRSERQGRRFKPAKKLIEGRPLVHRC